MSNKVYDREQASAICDRVRSRGGDVVFTNGCFDIIHKGHVRYLNEAKARGDFLVVGINSDASVSRIKGKGRPIVREDARAEVLASLEMVDCVVIFDEDTPIELIRALKPDVLVKGGDYTLDRIVGASFVLDNGGKVEVLPFLDGYSTSDIVDRIIDLYRNANTDEQ